MLDNKMKDRDAEKLVLLNAAAAIYIAGGADGLSAVFCRDGKHSISKRRREIKGAGESDEMSETFLDKILETTRDRVAG